MNHAAARPPRPGPTAASSNLDLHGADAPGLASIAQHLNGLADRLTEDLMDLEGELGLLFRPPAPDPARAAARHLLDAGGKLVRPFLCLTSARTLPPADPAAAAAPLARAAELLHAATLLHDDVVDEGDLRRGVVAARLAHGNAASVIGGDLLLVEALELVRDSGEGTLLDSFLGVLREMVDAEAVQLGRRGLVRADAAAWRAVAEGKTAALFGWTCEAGAHVAGADTAQLAALRGYGRELGLAFQLVDDLLDLAGDPAETGKSALVDLAQGTLGYPAVLAAGRDPALAARLARAATGAPDPELGAALLAATERTGALAATRAEARARTAAASDHLEDLPPSSALDALRALAAELAERAR